MTNNTQRPDDRPARKGHGLFDVLPQRYDPLPEGKWLFNDGELRCIEVEGEYAYYYVVSHFRAGFIFFPLFVLWMLVYYTGIGYLFKKFGFNVPSSSFARWVYDYPTFWGFPFDFRRNNFLRHVSSPRWSREIEDWREENRLRGRVLSGYYGRSR